MPPYLLGMILRDVGNFDMSTFNGRLTLQKTIYLLKSFGIDLGYVFAWYLHGVYSPELTKDGFELFEKKYDLSDLRVEFQNNDTQEGYNIFLKFMEGKKNDPDLLEISSSTCYLNQKGWSKTEVLKAVESKKSRFKKEDCVQIWDELEKIGVVVG